MRPRRSPRWRPTRADSRRGQRSNRSARISAPWASLRAGVGNSCSKLTTTFGADHSRRSCSWLWWPARRPDGRAPRTNRPSREHLPSASTSRCCRQEAGLLLPAPKGHTPAPLAPTARRALRSVGGQTAAALTTVATSHAYGAPDRTTKREPKPVADHSPQKPASLASALSSVAVTSNASGSGQIVLLLILIPLTAVAMLAARVLRRRSPSR